MKRLKQCASMLTGLLLIACSGVNRTESKGIIDVAGAMENVQELNVSQLGDKIRFVPLETNDNSLVADRWNFQVTDKYVILSNMGYGGGQKCMTFDLNTGKYVATVGHPGQDPEAYGNSFPVLDEGGSDVLYFFSPHGMVKYSMDGRFLGSINSTITRYSFPAYPLINDTVMTRVLSVSSPEGDRHISFLRTNLEGSVIDSTAVIAEGKPVGPHVPIRYFDARIRIYPSLMPHSGLEFSKIEGRREDKGQVVELIGPSQMWQIDGAVRFHQAFNDSIYGLTTAGAGSIVYIFDTGKWHYPVGETAKTKITSAHVFVTDMMETADHIVFAVSKGWLEEDNKGYIGLYDKRTGSTTVSEIEKGFRDDLAGFAPFYPVRMNGKGQLIGIMTMEDIHQWLEEHPDAERPAFVDTLAEDANPVLVIVEGSSHLSGKIHSGL